MLTICLSALLLLSSCGGGIPEGTYKAEVGEDGFEIKGKNQISSVEIYGESVSIIYKYKLGKNDKGEQIIKLTYDSIDYEGENEDVKAAIEDVEKSYESGAESEVALSFEMGDGYVKIGGRKYVKK